MAIAAVYLPLPTNFQISPTPSIRHLNHLTTFALPWPLKAIHQTVMLFWLLTFLYVSSLFWRKCYLTSEKWQISSIPLWRNLFFSLNFRAFTLRAHLAAFLLPDSTVLLWPLVSLFSTSSQRQELNRHTADQERVLRPTSLLHLFLFNVLAVPLSP